jgi:hypothetical protein
MGMSGGDGGAQMDGGSAPLVWLPRRVRRLSNRELDNSAMDLLGTTTLLSSTLGPDTRQSGFTLNADQRVDDTYGGQLQGAADALAQEAVTKRLSTLVPCASSANRACAATFVESFAGRAFRRPLTDDDRNGLLAVYDVAAGGTGGTFNAGIAAIISAALQSASFLYLTELGGDATGDLVELAPYEAASQLSYLVAAAPPDQPLLDAAAQNMLGTADQREAQARRLLTGSPHAAQQVARVLKEWMRLDQLSQIDRVTTVADSFATLSPLFDQETDAFIAEVMKNTDGTLSTLLTANFTMVNDKLAAFYGVPYSGTGWVRTQLDATTRRGLLSQANFLTTYSSTAPIPSSSPVKRGKEVLNQMLCNNVQFPTDPSVVLASSMPPPLDPMGTTRQRFAAHATDPACSGCHQLLDGIGFGFENFDQIGKFRSTENGNTVDASGTLVGTDVDGAYTNNIDLVNKLATSDQVRHCFAKNFFRFASGQTSDGTEAQYMDVWGAMPTDARTQIVELMVGYIRSDMFMKRRVVK